MQRLHRYPHVREEATHAGLLDPRERLGRGRGGGQRRHNGGEGAKRKGNDEPDAMVWSDFGKTHRGSEQRDEHGLALMADGAPAIFGQRGWNHDVEGDDAKPTPQTVRPEDVG